VQDLFVRFGEFCSRFRAEKLLALDLNKSLFDPLARDGVYFFGEKMFKGNLFKFFAKIVARGNAVQIFSNFPAKRLSIYRKKNLSHLFIS